MTLYSGKIYESYKPARKVPTSVQSQKMTVMNILDKTTRENSPQSSRHSQLQPSTQHSIAQLESSQSPHTSAKAMLFARWQHHLQFDSGFPYAPLKAMVTKISK